MKQHHGNLRLLELVLLVVLSGGLFSLTGNDEALADGAFTVNSSGDGNVRDAVLTLREAIALANNGTGGGEGLGRTLTNGEKDQIGGGCTFGGSDDAWLITGGCGAVFFDTIGFDPSITVITFTDTGVLHIADNGTWINGNNGIPRLDARNLLYDTFVIDASHVTISNLSLVNGQPSGLVADIMINGGVDSRIAYNYIGTLPGATNCTPGGVTRNGWSGIRVHGNHIGNSMPNGAAAYIYGNVVGCHPGHAIYIDHSDYVVVGFRPDGLTGDGSWLGVSRTGEALPNTMYGVFLFGENAPFTAAHNTIAHSVISGNGGSGIAIRGSNSNWILNNKVGVNPAGTTALPNGGNGIDIYEAGSYGNLIGGEQLRDSNVISGNTRCGIQIRDGARENKVDSNLIGLNAGGTAANPNREAGVAIFNSNNNFIGSPTSTNQYISGNTREGIYIENSNGNSIGPANVIGISSNEIRSGNEPQGIMLNGASNTTVTPPIVGYNGAAGIAVMGNTATGNNVSVPVNLNNGGLPIDLGNDGFTPNGLRTPPGPNDWLNYPVITSSSGSALTGTACANCTVFIYRASGNPSTPGGGGSVVFFALADGAGHWSTTLPGGLTNRDVSLVAVQAPFGATGNTSEMSPRPILYLPTILR